MSWSSRPRRRNVTAKSMGLWSISPSVRERRSMPPAKSNYEAWAKRAESDLLASRVLAATANPPWEIICFHAQQAAEKFLKAFLIKNGWSLRKTHDLSTLLAEAVRHDGKLAALDSECRELTPYIISGRYPDLPVDEAAGRNAIESAEKLASALRSRVAT